MAIALKEGTLLFRAKWTAKEVYVHTRAFGPVAGARYVVERIERLQRRSRHTWASAEGPVPDALRTTVVYGDMDLRVCEDSPVVRFAAGDENALRDVIPLARTVVFAGSVPVHLKDHLQSCATYGVRVVYAYGPPTLRDRLRGHRLLVSRSDEAVFRADPARVMDVCALTEGARP